MKRIPINFFVNLKKVYDGDGPDVFASEVLKLSFPMKLDDSDINLYYAQLLMIEQDFNYGPQGCKRSRLNPPREFLMCVIRWVASRDEEIDKIIFCAVRNKPPLSKYAKRLI
jgi:hypothetical protein